MNPSHRRQPNPMAGLWNLLSNRFRQAISVFNGYFPTGYPPAAVPIRVPSRRSQR